MDSLEDFTRKFHSQYIDADEFDLKPESEFRQLGSWDSLTGMAVLVMIKEEYNVDIPVESFKKMKTVEEIYKYIISFPKNK